MQKYRRLSLRQMGEKVRANNFSKGLGLFYVAVVVIFLSLLFKPPCAFAPLYCGPGAQFTWSPGMPAVGEIVTFDGSESSSGGGSCGQEVPITSWDWQFGDGHSASGKIVTHSYSSPGTYTVTLVVTDNLGRTYPAYQYARRQKQLQVALAPLDLSISSIKPVQVVWNSDINNDGTIELVAGKSIMFRVYVKMENYQLLNDQASIGIQLIFDGTGYIQYRTVEQLKQKNYVDFYLNPPSLVGVQIIKAKIDPENMFFEHDKTNNEYALKVLVKETKDLTILYVKVNSRWPANYGAPDPQVFQNTKEESGKFIQTVYPVRNRGILTGIYPGELLGSPSPYCLLRTGCRCLYHVPVGGYVLDMQTLALLAGKTGWDRVVGVVSDSYFPYHNECYQGKCYLGVSYPNVKGAVLVQGGIYTAAAHEIGHTYDLPEEYKVDNCEVTYIGDPASGHWVEMKEDIENSISFMGPYSTTIPTWVDLISYSNLFNKLKKGVDPDSILLIAGSISSSGEIKLDKGYLLGKGEISEMIPGDYMIGLIDKNGQTIEKVDFDVPFVAYIEPFGAVETDSAPFVFAIPYPENTFKIQIKHNDETLLEFDPNAKLLHGAVDSIPIHGFVKNPDERRNALHNKIDALEKMIQERKFYDAIDKLTYDIQDKFEKWLIDGYEKENPLQLSKQEILELVKKLIDRLNYML